MTSLRNIYALLFPDLEPFEKSTVPLLPADIFAFCAYLVEASGAYHHIAPAVAPLANVARRIAITSKFRERAVEAGRDWLHSTAGPASIPPPPRSVKELWDRFKTHSGDDVYTQLEPLDFAPAWWEIALELLIVADEASQRLGFDISQPFYKPLDFGSAESDLLTASVFRQFQDGPRTFSTAARSVVCVQAKSRTPSVGCTLRSLTHHLALLPGQGQVRARWMVPPLRDQPKEEFDNHLGLLLVPFPFRVRGDCFRDAGVHENGRWGWFEVDQLWLPRAGDATRRMEFVDFVVDLVRQARSIGQKIDGVVLPELSLDYPLYRQLALRLATDPNIDFLIAGVSADEDKRLGNYVLLAPFFVLGRDRSSVKGFEGAFLAREKHHRWKLTESQTSDYGIATQLKSAPHWWERLDILGRGVDLVVYRGKTTLTTLICEDLARVDPCQSVLRAIGPNLVIALLMDGPQLKHRWPARYATVLADDPGSSVLTFTSFGLIDRQASLGKYDLDPTVALWKDETEGVKPLKLQADGDAIVLNLRSIQKTEHTLDGRPDAGMAEQWVLDNYTSIKAMQRPSWIRSGSAGRRKRQPLVPSLKG